MRLILLLNLSDFMIDKFELEVMCNGVQKEFHAKLLLQGYTHKFKVLIDGTEVFFEPDEEGSYRVVKMPWQNEKELQKIDVNLLQAIQEKIVSILR